MPEKTKKIILHAKKLSKIDKKERFFSVLLKSLKEILPFEVGLFFDVNKDGNYHFQFLQYDEKRLIVTKLAKDCSIFGLQNLGPVKRALETGKWETSLSKSDWMKDTTHENLIQFLNDNYQFNFRSCQIIPLLNFQGEKVGIFLLFNVHKFNEESLEFASLLVDLALSSYSNHVQNNDLKLLFESFVRLLAKAIDDKSPYTGGHCRRVPSITMMIAKALNEVDYGPFKNYHLDVATQYELELAALLHDCGKIVTPTHIMDKATKLQTIFDRIHLIEERFEIVKRDLEIESLRKTVKSLESDLSANQLLQQKKLKATREKQLNRQIREVNRSAKFVKQMNFGQEVLDEHLKNKIKRINYKYRVKKKNQIEEDFFSSNELRNLSISRGTLLPEERKIINQHIDITIEMLEAMHFPEHLKRIPEFAGGHHEKMDGTGYPKKLKREEMSIEARIMGVADVFEALTASDRPYKKGKLLSETLKIMGRMKEHHAIDPDIFDVFIDQKVYLQYAHEFLQPYQIDEINEWDIPCYQPLSKRLKIAA